MARWRGTRAAHWIYILVYVITYIHTYIHTYVRTYVCMYVCMYVITYTSIYIQCAARVPRHRAISRFALISVKFGYIYSSLRLSCEIWIDMWACVCQIIFYSPWKWLCFLRFHISPNYDGSQGRGSYFFSIVIPLDVRIAGCQPTCLDLPRLA